MTKALNPAYVMYEAPDLDRMQSFMIDFGLSVAARTATDLWMAAADGGPYVHHTRLASTARFVGAGFEFDSLESLHAVAAADAVGVLPQPSSAPGGGWCVTMTMPDGFRIDAVAGQTRRVLSQEPTAQDPLNFLQTKGRFNRSVRVAAGVHPVRRLGHFVLHVSNHDASVAWLKTRLGLLDADYFGTDETPPQIHGTFLRVDQGGRYVDHHCLLVLQSQNLGSHHCSFEMTGLDDLMSAHDHLLGRGYRLDVGVGRHMLGSQIFDYWKDPFGFRVEHYTDGDVVNDQYWPTVFSGTADETTQWGARPDPSFFD
jgi:hypothetical protein